MDFLGGEENEMRVRRSEALWDGIRPKQGYMNAGSVYVPSSCLKVTFTPFIYLSLVNPFMETAREANRLTTVLKCVLARPINYDPV